MKNSNSILFAICGLILFFSGCEKITSFQVKCQGSIAECPQPITLSIHGESTQFVADLLNEPEQTGFGILSARLDRTTFQKIETQLTLLNFDRVNEQTKNLPSTALVLYFDLPNESEFNQVRLKDIGGFSSFKFVSRRLHHEFFSHKETDLFEWYEGLSAYSPKIIFNHLNAILRTITIDDHASKGYILLVNEDNWEDNQKLTVDGLSPLIRRFEKSESSSFVTTPK